MASAVKRTREVRKTVTDVVPDGVTLTLTQAEAETLLMVHARIGGDPMVTRRLHTDGIGQALRNAGVVKPDTLYSDELSGGLTFRPSYKYDPLRDVSYNGLIASSNPFGVK
jgi:hypothetical protein